VPQSEKVRLRLQALDERLARLRMEKNRLIARVSQTERKRDTRPQDPDWGRGSRSDRSQGCTATAIDRGASELAGWAAHSTARSCRVRLGAARGNPRRFSTVMIASVMHSQSASSTATHGPRVSSVIDGIA
jgi:hypothetical protein